MIKLNYGGVAWKTCNRGAHRKSATFKLTLFRESDKVAYQLSKP
jgi:hypothetical protein